ncbi:dioxygenase [Actinomyces sp. oral taxon 414]|uniref:AmmeMemoRadiSam system protein B n=1 Tax=Actinomyces sp. oral taxon 414 TaxID=712122 RepID=UPI0006AE24A7|nr:AmmeMemoRadiSam system protein B [Actinomyces sp. oral taxon 414]ALC98871.1 dioxygenase [Actinomyces sp. oral taxon 414]
MSQSSQSQQSQQSQQVRAPAVAGLFYPAEPARLRADVEAMLAAARRADDGGTAPAALIVPHAGYVYSGPTAALAWARAGARRGQVRRVVMLGPAHRVGVRALALPGCRAMDTPLGPVEVEVPAQIEELAAAGLVVTRPDVHAAEHSLEVQLPFLTAVLPGASVVPLAVGWVAPDRAAEAIRPFLGRPDTLVVVSSDLSHYLPLAEARRVDEATIERILALRADIDHEEACGATGVNALLLAAGERGLVPRLLGSATSADTIGSPDRVVGYAAVAFYEE